MHIGITRAVHAGSPAEGYPSTFYPSSQRDLAMLAAQRVFQHRKHTGRSLLSIFTEQQDPLAQQGEHRGLGIIFDVAAAEGMQVPEGKAAPGRAQYGQPGDAIHGMQKRTRERGKILYLLAFA